MVFRCMSGGRSRLGSGDSVSEIGQSHSFRLVANKLLGSNAAYLVIFRLKRLGRYAKTLLGPGPISNTEMATREFEREPNS